MMKTSPRLLLLAVLAVPAGALAQSSVTLYGIVDAAVESARAGGGTHGRLVTGALSGSRLGVRGSEDLGGGLSATFRLESGVNVDDGTVGQGGRMWGREAAVGLSHARWGSVTAGRLQTPYWLVQSAVDAFAWGGSGALTAISRGGAATRQLLPLLITARQDNAVAYAAPKLGGLELRALVSAGEGAVPLGRSYFVSARYRQGPFDAVAAWGTQRTAGAGQGRVRAWVLGGSVDLGAAKLHAGITDERNGCGACTGTLARVADVTGDGDGAFRLVNVGLRVPFGRTTAIAQYVRVDDRSAYAVPTGSRDAHFAAVGLEHALSKRTTLHGSVGTVGNRNGSRYTLGSGSAQQRPGILGDGDPRSTTATLGLRHVF